MKKNNIEDYKAQLERFPNATMMFVDLEDTMGWIPRKELEEYINEEIRT